MTKLEEMARAIEPMCRAFGRDDMPMQVAREFVLAALEALAEPSRGMVNAAWSDYENAPNGTLVKEPSTHHAVSDDDLENDTAFEVWHAMIHSNQREGK